MLTRNHRRTWLTALLALLVAAAGCGGGGGAGGDTGGGADTGPSDDGGSSKTEPPEVRQVDIAIKGEFSSRLDLNDDETVERILPTAAEAEVTVFASDDETDAQDLSVEVVDADGEPLEGAGESFNNGLWKITVELAPGVSARVEVTDAQGNTTESAGTLVIPSREGALPAEWERRFYNADEEITDRWNRTISEDGSWEETQGQRTLKGSYAVDGDDLQITVESDSAEASTHERTVSSFYVDDTYFDHLAWTRKSADGDEGLAGTWTRSYEIHRLVDGSHEPTRTVTETLELEPVDGDTGDWTLTTTGTDSSGSNDEPIDETASGTWNVIENESYSGNYGNFLRRTTTHRDGSKLNMPETDVELFHMPLDKLLISPYLRSPEQG